MIDTQELKPSDFRTDGKRAWWITKDAGVTKACLARGIGVLTTLQSVLRSALRGGWKGVGGVTFPRRPVIDGNFGPETGNALYAYAVKKKVPANLLSIIKTAISTKKIDLQLIRICIWLAYYQTRLIDLDIEGKREQREDLALLGLFPVDEISLPSSATPWNWMGRPQVPADLQSLGIEIPECDIVGDSRDLGTMQPDPPAVPIKPASSSGSGAFWLLLLFGAGVYAMTGEEGK